jgi:hypothetical protein
MAKAIRDNKQLDCYFTRAFYKHILNIHGFFKRIFISFKWFNI